MQARAVRWYNEALPKLTGLDKAKVERRVKSSIASEGLSPSVRGGVQPGNVALASRARRCKVPP